ncbi:MAG TPA: 4'-phosphopantetheinyl transferase superfamily protein [Candidatus Dormibacteraeota bacterium]|nr:4'-phosphopantetheinyl transferase superfamily protein [Candidatus Dormibacteraeota bacterium]
MTDVRVARVADRVHAAAATTSVLAETREGVAVRALLRTLLARVAGERAATTPIAARPSGQPYLPALPGVEVSLSHAGVWMAAAVHTGGGRVGIDVQPALTASDRMVTRCCTPAARAALVGLPEPLRAVELAWIWSVQEACVKATGAGISGRPWTIPVEVGQTAGRWSDLAWSELRGWLPVPVSCAHGAPDIVP